MVFRFINPGTGIANPVSETRMHSIKPGRAPSWAAVIGGIIATVLGCLWISTASSMGAPALLTAFGVAFVLMAAGSVIYHLYNATSRNRFSHWDITTHEEERDPLTPPAAPARHCPHCGSSGMTPQFQFCPSCGKPLPGKEG